MVVVSSWDEFFAKAEELCRANALGTRYSVRYKHKEGKLVMKVTDDVTVSTCDDATRRHVRGESAPRRTFA